MFRLLAVFLFSFALLVPSWAGDVTNSDKLKFEDVISNQLEAFKTGDGPKAYSYAAPNVTKVFPNVDVFMSMVKNGYQAIYANNNYKFGVVATDTLGRPAQHVTITADNGKRYEAIYAMEKQPDGNWKIAGVQMIEIPGLDV